MVRVLKYVLISVVLLISCTKKQERAVAFISVTTHQGFVVQYPLVNFYVASNNVKKGSLDTTIKGDIYGHVEFVRYHDCFLDVIALKTDTNGNTQAGSVSLQMIQGQTTIKTIAIN